MYEKILIPTDGSDAAEVAAKHGAALAGALGAKACALYVIDTSAFVGMPAGTVSDHLKCLLEEEGKKAIDVVKKLAKQKGVECETMLKEGSPYKKITDVAEEEKVDLIVMGTAGRVGMDRFLIGSVAEKVIRMAPCPTMVVHE